MNKQILIDAKLKSDKVGQRSELNGRSPLRRRKSALDCSTIQKKMKKRKYVHARTLTNYVPVLPRQANLTAVNEKYEGVLISP